VEIRVLMRAAVEDHEHVNMDTCNGTYYCYRLNYRYNVVLVLSYPLDSGHMHYAASHHVLWANDPQYTVR